MADDFDDFTAPSETGGSSVFNVASLSPGAKRFIKEFMPDDDDSGCIGTFYMEHEFQTFESRKQSEEKGEPVEVFKDILYISIDIKGSNLNAIRRPAQENDKKRFPFSWQEFKKGESARERGIPLAKLGLDAQTVREYASVNVFTIEDLSQVSDNHLQRMGVGAREWRLRAKEYLSTHKAAAESSTAVSQLQESVAQLMAANERLMEENKKLNSKTLSLKKQE